MELCLLAAINIFDGILRTRLLPRHRKPLCMKLKKRISTIISFIFSRQKEPAATGMMKKISELEAQNEELAVINDHLMEKLNEDTLRLFSKKRK